MSTEIIIAIVSAGGGGAILSALLTYFLGKRTAKRDDFSILVDTWKEDNKRLRQRVDLLEKENDLLEKRVNEQDRLIHEMEMKLAFTGEADNKSALPMWRKDSRGKMLVINDAYEALFLLPNGLTKADYIGKTDEEVWGKETGRKYQDNDRMAQEMGYFAGVESVRYDKGRDFGKWLVLKYRVMSKVGNAEIVMGTKGLCIPLKGIID